MAAFAKSRARLRCAYVTAKRIFTLPLTQSKKRTLYRELCKSDAGGGCGGSSRGVTCHEIEAQCGAGRRRVCAGRESGKCHLGHLSSWGYYQLGSRSRAF